MLTREELCDLELQLIAAATAIQKIRKEANDIAAHRESRPVNPQPTDSDLWGTIGVNLSNLHHKATYALADVYNAGGRAYDVANPKTINVVEIIDGTVTQFYAYADDNLGTARAINKFRAIAGEQKHDGKPVFSRKRIEEGLADGYLVDSFSWTLYCKRSTNR